MDIHVPTIVWAIINFLILVAILNIFLYKPILKILDDRKAEVENNLNEAENNRNETERFKAEYAEILKNADKEADKIISKANKAGEELKNSLLEEARAEAAKISAKAKEDIQNEKNAALNELKDEIASIAVLATEKILSKSIDPKDHEKMVQDFVKEVGEAH